MLGYVRPAAEELRLREHTVWRGLYCGLCHRMGKCTGNCSRMTLNYDFVFLAAVRMSLLGEAPVLKKQRCLLHPLCPRPTAVACSSLDYAADASALLVYHKLCDDIHDERGAKRLGARMAHIFLRKAYRKAQGRYPELDKALRTHLQALSDLERSPNPTGADPLAERFGFLMAAVFSEGLTGADARIADNLGQALGHWIYLADAADDFEEDIKKGRFNPYRALFGAQLSNADRTALRDALVAHLCRMEQSIALIDSYPSPELRELLSNILYLGLPATGERITAPPAPKRPVTEHGKAEEHYEKSL